MQGTFIATISLTGALLLSACVSPDQAAKLANPRAGFDNVGSTTAAATGKETVWIQSGAEAAANAKRVQALVYKKTISADTAVQVALLNNKGLQAAYADLGLSSTDVWQQTLQPNPTVSVGLLGIGAKGLGGFRAIEGMIANNILSLVTRDKRRGIADIHFRQAQLVAAEATLRVATDTRRAWVEAVAAYEAAGLIAQAQGTANAASELAARLGEVGSLNKAEQAREHAFYAELTGQRAQAKLAAELAKEALTRQMGLWGADAVYYVPNALPQLPRSIAARPKIEAEALGRRVDLAIAKLELDAAARKNGLTDATRYVTDLEIIAGFEAEREAEDGEVSIETTPQIEVEFDIPIFDSGKARKRKAETAYMRAANELAEKAVNVRSEARSAYLAYTASHQIARHYRDAVLPLRRTIEEEGLLSYNGMITNTFELLADTRARLNSNLLEGSARRDFWLADANMVAAVYGGGAAAGGGGESGGGVADEGGAGH
ncbi:TolC family protein [Cypionkella sp. TWP1-2-1b2]|uniref:TolC family protein n=1 Tax=Cypionkella sp. TWP1-2-1b2 TaxID=2804675 RepID=UPI003CEE964A